MSTLDGRERDEFLISQYLDGTLSPDERAALESRLAAERELAALLAEHQRVDAMVHDWAMDVPTPQWSAIESGVRLARRADDGMTRSGRYPMRWLRPVAAAAVLALAATVAFQFGPSGTRTRPSGPVVSLVTLHRPEAVEVEKSFVSYGRRKGGDAAVVEANRSHGVIAMATVGGRVTW